jgi:hypothetical protein
VARRTPGDYRRKFRVPTFVSRGLAAPASKSQPRTAKAKSARVVS